MHPEFLSMALFWIVAAYTPGPNNVIASYSGFNFGIKKTLPHIFGVTFGFTTLVFSLIIGLVNIFKLFPIIQEILKYLGTIFLVYLAYKICFSGAIKEKKNQNPVSFFDTFIFQFLNPKGVLIGIIIVSTYVEYGQNYISYATQVVLFAFFVSLSSITFWAFVGKYLRKFATNEKFIKYFNYVMSGLLLLSVITFYI
ncbi:LysE family translocator [Candidatus Pelagibacter sp.]|uniref:LysE family translocator n=1 Tax=Candidatus Pelagibacter sp. TaxID=2024849 RepID=UPI003F82DC16